MRFKAGIILPEGNEVGPPVSEWKKILLQNNGHMVNRPCLYGVLRAYRHFVYGTVAVTVCNPHPSPATAGSRSLRSVHRAVREKR